MHLAVRGTRRRKGPSKHSVCRVASACMGDILSNSRTCQEVGEIRGLWGCRCL